MAAGDISRFYGKLEAVCKKSLPRGVYDRIVAKEACIAEIQGRTRRVKRFLILGHLDVYFSNVPPTTVSRSFSLDSIVCVSKVDAAPSFLGTRGKEAVHLHIKYRVVPGEAPPKGQRRCSLSDLTHLDTNTQDMCSESSIDVYLLKPCVDVLYHLNTMLEDNLTTSIYEKYDLVDGEVEDNIPDLYDSLCTKLVSATHNKQREDAMACLVLRAKRYFTLKRLFWRNSFMLEYCIEQLKINILCSKPKKIDYDYIIVIVELLLTMLQHTYIVEGRLAVLNYLCSIRVIHALVFALVQVYGNSKEIKVLEDMSSSVCGILYEIAKVADKMTHYDSAMHCREIAIQPNFDAFICAVTSDLCCNALTARYFLPHETAALLYQASVLLLLCEKTSKTPLLLATGRNKEWLDRFDSNALMYRLPARPISSIFIKKMQNIKDLSSVNSELSQKNNES